MTMAPKVFLLAVLLTAIAISECRPGVKKRSGDYVSQQQSQEKNNRSWGWSSSFRNPRTSNRNGYSSASENQENYYERQNQKQQNHYQQSVEESDSSEQGNRWQDQQKSSERNWNNQQQGNSKNYKRTENWAYTSQSQEQSQEQSKQQQQSSEESFEIRHVPKQVVRHRDQDLGGRFVDNKQGNRVYSREIGSDENESNLPNAIERDRS